VSNTFALNPTSTDKSLGIGGFRLGVGDVGKGPTDQTNFWASAPIGTFSYLIALDRDLKTNHANIQKIRI